MSLGSIGTPGLDLYPSPSIAPPTSLDATGFSSTASAACLPLGTAAAAALGATAAPAARGTGASGMDPWWSLRRPTKQTKTQGNLKWSSVISSHSLNDLDEIHQIIVEGPEIPHLRVVAVPGLLHLRAPGTHDLAVRIRWMILQVPASLQPLTTFYHHLEVHLGWDSLLPMSCLPICSGIFQRPTTFDDTRSYIWVWVKIRYR